VQGVLKLPRLSELLPPAGTSSRSLGEWSRFVWQYIVDVELVFIHSDAEE
jgi:hypothetical protein